MTKSVLGYIFSIFATALCLLFMAMGPYCLYWFIDRKEYFGIIQTIFYVWCVIDLIVICIFFIYIVKFVKNIYEKKEYFQNNEGRNEEVMKNNEGRNREVMKNNEGRNGEIAQSKEVIEGYSDILWLTCYSNITTWYNYLNNYMI